MLESEPSLYNFLLFIVRVISSMAQASTTIPSFVKRVNSTTKYRYCLCIEIFYTK